jgi:hypothetical protein
MKSQTPSTKYQGYGCQVLCSYQVSGFRCLEASIEHRVKKITLFPRSFLNFGYCDLFDICDL